MRIGASAFILSGSYEKGPDPPDALIRCMPHLRSLIVGKFALLFLRTRATNGHDRNRHSGLYPKSRLLHARPRVQLANGKNWRATGTQSIHDRRLVSIVRPPSRIEALENYDLFRINGLRSGEVVGNHGF
jgi:hypothetical protein